MKPLTLMAILLACVTSSPAAAEPAVKPNILFISIDDLGTWLGTYGKPYVHSPHIDRLAKSGIQFNRAYAQVPVCGASRASMMTGLLPTRTRLVDAGSSVDNEAPGSITLPQFLREMGYHTISYGKVFHVVDHEAHQPAVDLLAERLGQTVERP